MYSISAMERVFHRFIGNCTQEDVVERLFGSVSEFARQVELNGDEFVYNDSVIVQYDEINDIHTFFSF